MGYWDSQLDQQSGAPAPAPKPSKSGFWDNELSTKASSAVKSLQEDIARSGPEIGNAANFAVGGEALGAGLGLLGKAGKFAARGTMARFPALAKAVDRAGLLWHREVTSGIERISKMVSPQLAAKFNNARQAASLVGSGWQTEFANNMRGLDPIERFAVGKIMEGDFQPSVLEGMIKPDRIALVSNAAERNTALLQSMKQSAQDARLVTRSPDGTLHEFVGIGENYMPHRIVNTQQFIEDTPVAKEAVKTLIKNDSWAANHLAGITDKAEKEVIAREWLKDFHARMSGENEATVQFPGRPSFGHLMGRNLGLPGYETDLNLVFPQYAEHLARRIALANEFGPLPAIPEMVSGEAAAGAAIPGQSAVPAAIGPRAEYPRAFEELDALPDGLRKQIGMEAIDAAIGKMKLPGPILRTVGRPLINWQVYNKLGWGQLGQFGQIVSDIVPNGARGLANNLIKAAIKDPETRDFLSRSGAISHGVVRRAEEALTGGATNNFLEKTGFTGADLYARSVGALQGKTAAQIAAKDLYQMSKKMTPDIGPLMQKQYGKLVDQLKGLGIDPADAVKQAGILTRDQLLKAANSNAFKANFFGDALSLPRVLSTPEGRFFFQFKSWGYQQAKFIKDTVVKPAMKGDYGPLSRWLVGSQLSGEAIADIKSAVRNRKRPEGLARLIENEAQGSGLGVLDDVLNAVLRGDAGFYGLAGGPTMGDIASGVEATKELIKGRPKKAERFAIQRGLPLASIVAGPGPALFAPAIANTLVPPNPPKGK